MYSEFVSQVDETLGQVLEALERTGIEDNTLVIFTSDNGPVWYDTDVERLGHDSAGPLRGMKGDAWEAGHRVPFITRWPGQISPGSASDRLLCFTDLMATFAEIVGQELPSGAGEDSYSFLPSLLGREQVNRPEMVIKQDASVIRQGYWKLITHLGSGGFSTPRRLDPEPGGPKGQLYNLQRDLAETNNLWSEQPEVVQRLISALREYKSNQ
jgi:arylsulfatase A-like enzyme